MIQTLLGCRCRAHPAATLAFNSGLHPLRALARFVAYGR